MIKLVASDMDGTLLNSQHTISTETVAAIKEAQERGIEFIISTGRVFEEAYPVVKSHGIDCKYLVMNGGELRDESGNTIQTLYMDHHLVKRVVKVLEQHQLYIEYYTPKGVFTSSSVETCKRAVATKINFYFPQISLEEAYEMSETHSEYTKLNKIESVNELYESDLEIGKILSFSNNIDLIAKLRDDIPLLTGANATSSFPINLEITDRQANKGAAIKQYAEKKGISLSEVMCIGDSFNDESMLGEEFGVTFAMGNAHPKIIELAKYITTSNDDNGVGLAIKRAINNNL